jgi:hypothetical protein
MEGEFMRKKVLIVCLYLMLTALPALPQGPPFAAGLRTPTRVLFTAHGNLIVTEGGTTAANSGRVSLIDRTNGARRTLIDGLPSGVNGAGAEAAPSGPAGAAVRGNILYVVIGAGNGVLPGAAPGTELPNDNPASPILSSLLSIQTSASLDVTTGGFTLLPSDHARLKSGETAELTNATGEKATVRLVADFPNFTPSPRPDAPANVRAGNPFGVAVHGQHVYVVDASQNLIRRVDPNSGAYETLATFAPMQNPLPFGPPFIDAVPDSISVRGNELLVTTLTGFPFPQGRAEVRRVNLITGANEPYISGLTAGIDVQPLAGTNAVVVLEFSTNMTATEPGRARLVAANGTSTTLASGLPTPTGIAVDQRSGEIFIAHIFPGLITRVNAAATLPAAPPTAIIPVVASLPGAHGSHYKTSMQISNPHPFAISGKLVVHPQGASGAATDPSVAYTLAPFETKSYSDFLAAASVTGGASVDVIAAVGSAPVTVTTIANVAAEGMPLVQVPQVDPAQALTAGRRGMLVAPSDPATTRFNIGVRTLSGGAAITFRVHDAGGAEVRSVTHGFAPNYFIQALASDLAGGPLGANQSVVMTVDAGSAIVYGVSIDNASGDATLQIARGISE